MTMKDTVDAYITFQKRRGKRPSWLKGVGYCLSNYAAYLDECGLDFGIVGIM